MNYKSLNWKQINSLKYRADISVKGIFGIRFEYEKMCYAEEYVYRYMINGKRFGGHLGYPCNSFEHGKELCEEMYEKLCNNIINEIQST